MVASLFRNGTSRRSYTSRQIMTIKETRSSLVVAQFSDSHLFADINECHHGANVNKNLQQVLASLANNDQIDVIVFTGDLTQDHSQASYQNFATLVKEANLNVPVFYLAGNHDEPALYKKYLLEPTFSSNQCINTEHWQIQLIDSKSETPAGYVSSKSMVNMKSRVEENKFQLLMMHHHPVDVDYFIDRHGLMNQNEFWYSINELLKQGYNIQAIACGHVHRAMIVEKKTKHPEQSLDVYTCPATSIAFDPQKETVSSLGVAPSYRLFYLCNDGTINTEICFCS